MNKNLILVMITWTVLLLFGSYVFSAYTSVAGADTYLHQENDYITAINNAERGELYTEMRLACETNEGWKDDRCTRGYVVAAFTEALHGLNYLNEDSKAHIKELFAETELEVFWDTRVEYRYTTQHTVRDMNQDEIDEMVKERMLELLNN